MDGLDTYEKMDWENIRGHVRLHKSALGLIPCNIVFGWTRADANMAKDSSSLIWLYQPINWTSRYVISKCKLPYCTNNGVA